MPRIRMLSVILLAGLLALPACQRTTTQPQNQTAQPPAAETPPAPAETASPASPAAPAAADQQQAVAGRETDLSDQMQFVRSDGSSIPLENPSRILQIETQLVAHGVNPGTVDGSSDVALLTAMREFQHQHGLPESGKLDAKTASALDVGFSDLNLGDIEKVSGTDDMGERLRRAGERVREGIEKGAEELTKPIPSSSTTEAPAHRAPLPPPVLAPIPSGSETTPPATPQTQSPAPSPGQPANQPQTEGRY
jgi:peptidoglycan hydrolase-like protein with peptidoglycan-binding domain